MIHNAAHRRMRETEKFNGQFFIYFFDKIDVSSYLLCVPKRPCNELFKSRSRETYCQTPNPKTRILHNHLIRLLADQCQTHEDNYCARDELLMINDLKSIDGDSKTKILGG